MNSLIPKIVPDIDEEDVDLLGRPLVRARKRRHREGLHSSRAVLELDPAELLVFGVLGPLVERPLEGGDGHVDEAGGLQVQGLGVNVGAAELLRGAVEELAPLRERVLLREGAVVRGDEDVELLQLDPATWFEVPFLGVLAVTF